MRRGILATLVALTFVCLAGLAPPAQAAPGCGVLATGASAQAKAAVAHACGLIGTPYSWGGGHGPQPGPSYGLCDPANGAPNDCHVVGLDCSGLVRYAYSLAVGADVLGGGTAANQWTIAPAYQRFGAGAGIAPLLPGDLLFYSSNGTVNGIHHVAIYLGAGYIVEAPFSGGFVRQVPTSTHGDYFGAVRLYKPGKHDRDYSGDGFGDMVTITADGYLDYYPNNAATNPGHLPFTGAQNRSPNPTWGGTKIAAGDFSGDGVADLLVRDDTGHLCIYPNNASSNPGGNPFIGASWCSTDTNLANIKQLAAGDVSGDGFADMVIIDDQGRLQYYPNNAATNPGHVPFISAQTVSGPTWGDTKALSLGDVSGDGAADLYAVTGSGTLDYYPNNAATNPNHEPFRNAQIVSGPTWGGVNTISLTDISGDGSADLLCVDNNDGYLHYYPNNAASNPGGNPFIGEAWHSAGPTWANARLA